MRYKACKCGGELRQIVVQNDKISLDDIAPKGGRGVRGCPCIKKGCPGINSLSNSHKKPNYT